jgi:hypothetical protein
MICSYFCGKPIVYFRSIFAGCSLIFDTVSLHVESKTYIIFSTCSISSAFSGGFVPQITIAFYINVFFLYIFKQIKCFIFINNYMLEANHLIKINFYMYILSYFTSSFLMQNYRAPLSLGKFI